MTTITSNSTSGITISADTTGNLNFVIGSDEIPLISNGKFDLSSSRFVLPKGNTSQRPTESPGLLRFNTESRRFESYNGNTWINLSVSPPTPNISMVEYFLVGAGASGAYNNTTGTGGSGGGVVAGSITDVYADDSFTVTVGAGGASRPVGGYVAGNPGSSSTFYNYTAGGGTFSSLNAPLGGSPQGLARGTYTGGPGAGGQSPADLSGGVGLANTIFGSTYLWGAGGGSGNSGLGGADGGGDGATPDTVGQPGDPNSGGGGGGGRHSGGKASGAGGSGIVIIKYPDIYTVTNPDEGLTFTTDSDTYTGYKLTTFTAGTGTIVWEYNWNA